MAWQKGDALEAISDVKTSVALPGKRGDECASVFSGADSVSARCIHDDDALLRGGWNLNVVHTSSCAADNFKAIAGIDDFLHSELKD